MSLAQVYADPFADAHRLNYARELSQLDTKSKQLGEFIEAQIHGDGDRARGLLKKVGAAALGGLKSAAASVADTQFSRGFPVSCRLKRVNISKLQGLDAFATLIHVDLYRVQADPSVAPAFLSGTRFPALRSFESAHWTWLEGLPHAHFSVDLLELRNIELSTNQWATADQKRALLAEIARVCPKLIMFECVRSEPGDIDYLRQHLPNCEVRASELHFSKRSAEIAAFVKNVEQREVRRAD